MIPSIEVCTLYMPGRGVGSMHTDICEPVSGPVKWNSTNCSEM